MKKREANIFAMMKNTETLLNENINKFSGVTEITELLNSFKNVISRIVTKEELKRMVLAGKTLRKLSEKNEAIRKAMAISGALYAYAVKTKNIELTETADIYRSDFKKLRDNELPGVLETLKDITQEHLRELEHYGVTAETYNSFSEKINLYKKALSQREAGNTTRSGAVVSLKELFREAGDILVTIDRLVNGLDEEYPEFVREYTIARAVKNLGVRHKATDTAKENKTPDNQVQQKNEPS